MTINLSRHRITYVVAREGLIVVSLLFCLGGATFLGFWVEKQITLYVNDAIEVGLVRSGNPNGLRASIDVPYGQSTKTTSFFGTEFENYYGVPGVKAQFSKRVSYEVISRTMESDFSGFLSGLTAKDARDGWVPLNSPTNTNINARYDDKGNKLFTSFLWHIDFMKIELFLVFAYPFYLLIRFIVWAAVTVKGRGAAVS